MPECADFNLFVGSESGLLKGVSVNPKANIAKNFHVGTKVDKLSKEDEITCLTWGQREGGGGNRELLMALKNRTVRVFDVVEKCFSESIMLDKQDDCPEGEIKGLARCNGSLVTASQSGVVKVWRYNKKDAEGVKFNTIDTEIESSGKLKRDDFENESERVEHVATLRADRELCRMRQAPNDPHMIATGGKENDLQIWDLNRPEAPVFRARNVKPNFLELRVPVWVSDICFPDASTPSLVSVATRHGHVRLYDARIENRRRPVRELFFPDESLTAMSATQNVNQVLVGSAQGRLALFDFRSESKGTKGLFRKYKGFVGSVRSIDCMRDGPHFAAVGLDRFLRVFDINSRKATQRMYLKSRLNCVLLTDSFDPNKTEQERQEKEVDEVEILEEEEEDKELWDTMGVVGGTDAKTVDGQKRKKAVEKGRSKKKKSNV